MNKILLLLSVIAFFSCSNEEIYNEKENVSQNLPEEKSILHKVILRRLLLIIAIRHGQGQKEALAKLQKLTLLVTMLIVEPEQQLTDHITYCML